ncbi:FliM/FliN family flagellar motor switch protein [Roseicyclus sp.]|uniref:FliM/FliN family flagellar motor switch protein n=1 Tax=Roseicyclus sp. TaxID=1914329 RepID=UPI003FA10AAE
MTEEPDPATSAGRGVIARVVAAHRRGAEAARDRAPVLGRAWGRALRHAAVPFRGLELALGETTVREGASLSDAAEALPEHGLVVVLEDRDGKRGIFALSHGAVDALIEVQTTGRVEATALPPRPSTRIDEALTRDFIDITLAAFARETDTIGDRDWADRLGYGSPIADRRQLNLLLPEHGYHVLTAALRFGGERGGSALIAVPRTGRAPGGGTEPTEQPETWRSGLEAALGEVELDLDAVLLRVKRPLGEVERLEPGYLIRFDPGALASVALETPSGRRVVTGRLGQVGGRRALRLSDGSGAADARPAPSAAPAPLPPAGYPDAGFPASGFPAAGLYARGFPAPGFPAPGLPEDEPWSPQPAAMPGPAALPEPGAPPPWEMPEMGFGPAGDADVPLGLDPSGLPGT